MFFILFNFNLSFIYLLFSLEIIFFFYVLLNRKYKFTLYLSTIIATATILIIYGHEVDVLLSRIRPTDHSVVLLFSLLLPSKIADIIFHTFKFLSILEPLYPITQIWQVGLQISLAPFFLGILIFPIFLSGGEIGISKRIWKYITILFPIISFLTLWLLLLLFVLFNFEVLLQLAPVPPSLDKAFNIEYNGDIYPTNDKLLMEKEQVVLIPKGRSIKRIEVRNEEDGSVILPEQSINTAEAVTFSVSGREIKYTSEKVGLLSRKMIIDLSSIMCDAKVSYIYPYLRIRGKLFKNVKISGTLRHSFSGKYTIKIHMPKNTLLESIPKYAVIYGNIPTKDVFEYYDERLYKLRIELYYVDFPLTLPKAFIKVITRPPSDTISAILVAILAPGALILWFRSQIFGGIKRIFKGKKPPIGFIQR